MDPIITPLVGILAAKGFGFLKDLIVGATDEGISKTKEFIETKTGIPLVDGAGQSTVETLTDEQLKKIAETIEDNHLELEQLLVRKMEIIAGDASDARDMQRDALTTAKEVTKTGNAYAIRQAWFSANFIYFYALIITLLSYVFESLVLFVEFPADKSQYLNQIISTNSNVKLILVGFFFGGAVTTAVNAYTQKRRASDSRDDQTN
jgi:hypothetical protein